jgi:hypothetical protein
MLWQAAIRRWYRQHLCMIEIESADSPVNE